ncbi:MAG: LysR family transcriptional regulator [Pseudomonadota bacterium]
MFEWSDIRILLAVARSGSTLGAARTLGINQTTVSRRVQSLEHALGLALFDRDTRGYAPTSNGKALLELAEEMERSADQIGKRAVALKRGDSGCIRLSIPTDIYGFWLNPVITAYKQKHSDVTFQIDDTQRRANLSGGEADIAIRGADEIDDESLIARKLGDAVWGVYCSKAYLSVHGLPRSADELAGHPVAFYGETMVANVALLRRFLDLLDPSAITQTFNSTAALSQAVDSGEAIGLLPRVNGRSRPELIECFSLPDFRSPVWLVTSRDGYQVPLIRDFMKFVGGFGMKDDITLV